MPFAVLPTVCEQGLGMEDGSISSNKLTASSTYAILGHRLHGPNNARLNHPADSSTTGAWSAATSNLNQWIQADLGVLKWVSGVVTQGRNGGGTHWVTKFIVQYSENGRSWSNVEDNKGKKVRK